MSFSWPRGLTAFCAGALSAAMAFPQGAIAQDHVVSTAQVQKDLQAAGETRRKQLAVVDGFLGTEQARKAMMEADIDYRQRMLRRPGISVRQNGCGTPARS